jgi:hypothetical protein
LCYDPNLKRIYLCHRHSNDFSGPNPQKPEESSFRIPKQKYLATYKNDSAKATWVLFGAHTRPMACLLVEPLGKKREALAFHFLVDTESPTTHLFEEALKAVFEV